MISLEKQDPELIFMRTTHVNNLVTDEDRLQTKILLVVVPEVKWRACACLEKCKLIFT